MAKDNSSPFELDFDSYILQSEPEPLCVKIDVA